jgi:hypothetical protein
MPGKRPEVVLGELREGGVAPAIMAIIDRGVNRRPELAAGLLAEVELMMDGYPTVRIVFEDAVVRVEDVPASEPDLRVSGSLPDLVGLMVAPLVGGVPNPFKPGGRAAIGNLAGRRVRIQGRPAMLRRFLGLISL